MAAMTVARCRRYLSVGCGRPEPQGQHSPGVVPDPCECGAIRVVGSACVVSVSVRDVAHAWSALDALPHASPHPSFL